MFQSKARLTLIGVAAAASGALFGWVLAGMPASIVPQTMMTSSVMVPTSAPSEDPTRRPAPPSQADEAAPKPAPAPAAAPPPPEEKSAAPKGADAPAGKKGGGYGIETPSTKFNVDPGSGKGRVKISGMDADVDMTKRKARLVTPFGDLDLDW